MPTPIQSVTIYGTEVQPAVDSLVLIGDNLVGERLLPGDEAVGDYRGSQFRYPRPNDVGPYKSRPVDVIVTGRTLQRRPYQSGYFVKVKIVWVRDGEPDGESPGWMLVR